MTTQQGALAQAPAGVVECPLCGMWIASSVRRRPLLQKYPEVVWFYGPATIHICAYKEAMSA